jgi:glycosyltransferase involved in cell wall biosynthesis
MKVAVYTIALNEENHIKKWYESAKEADYLLIADTGSTDKTVEIAKSLGINVIDIRIDPWRFDDARNASLAAIPLDIDYCIALDMDEVLVEGWKKDFQMIFDLGITKPIYEYVHGWTENGEADLTFDGIKIHARKGYRWRYPIHEAICSYKIPETRARIDLKIHHFQDKKKSREQYLDILEMAVDEDPNCSRSLYYLGREYYYKQRYFNALQIFKKYLEISTFKAERSYALRMMSKCDPDNAEKHLLDSVDECTSKESVLALANHYYQQMKWEDCLKTALRGLDITKKQTDFISEFWAWGHMADDLCAISAWQLGKWNLALKHGERAVELSPNDERLQNNLKHYREKANEHSK